MKTKIIPREAVTLEQQLEMWRIYRKSYHYSESYFRAQLKKNTHFALYFRNQKIDGFTALRINRFDQEKRNSFLVYYGKTVLSRGDNVYVLLICTFVLLVIRYWKTILTHDTWFWYESKTYKTYLIAAKTLKTYYPSRKEETPEDFKEIIDHIGRLYYPESYCANTGTVLRPLNYMKTKCNRICPNMLRDEDIAFYASVNPKYFKGHRLLTCAPINQKNLVSLFKKLSSQYITNIKKVYWRQGTTREMIPQISK